MNNIFLTLSCFIIIFLALCPPTRADSFLVQDQHGLALKNVVLEFSVTSPSALDKLPPNTLIMDQVDKLFKPDVLVIHQGDFVDFPNSDNIRHHVYSFSSVNPFELKLYSGRPEAPLQFNTAGVAVLGCNIHDSMVGYIYIASSKYVLITDKHGLATLDAAVKYNSINVWHAGAVTSIKKVNYNELTIKANDNATFVIDLVVNDAKPRNTFQSIFKHNGK